MKSTATTSSSSSSVFAPYTKEESYQKMQLKHTSSSSTSSPTTPTPSTEMPVAKATTSNTTATSVPETLASTKNPVHIPYDIDWIFKRLQNPDGLWYVFSQIAISIVGLFSKIVLGE